jgi:preprotein translocase subunit SecG
METLILVLHVAAALCVIGLVLLQHGKGADMGAAFGSGSAGSLFGSSGSANFLSRTTAIIAAVFFLTSLGLTYVASHKGRPEGVMSTHQEEQPVEPEKAIPAPTGTVPQADGGVNSKANEVPK